MSAPWRAVVYRLAFRAGDRSLLSVSLKVYATQFSLDDALRGGAWSPPPLAELPSDLAGWIARSAPAGESAPRIARADGCVQYRLQSFERHFIDLRGTFDEYSRTHFSGKSRGTIQRKIRRFTEHAGGALDCRVYRTPADMDAFLPLARSVSEQTYQHRLFDAGLPDDAAFVAEMRDLARRDSARAYALFAHDGPVAYLYLPAEAGVLHYAYLGYLPAFREWSVGTILHWLALQQLFAEQRFTHLDFTEGEGEHKQLFATGHVRCVTLLVLRDRLRYRVLVHAHCIFDDVVARVGRRLDALGLKARIRRLSRYGLRGSPAKPS